MNSLLTVGCVPVAVAAPCNQGDHLVKSKVEHQNDSQDVSAAVGAEVADTEVVAECLWKQLQ